MKLKLDVIRHWTEFALCRGEDPFYEVQDSTGGRLGREQVSALLKRADRCFDCPVFLRCHEEATAEDRWWTIRAGEMPGVAAAVMRDWENKAKKPAPLPKSKPKEEPTHCGRGHELAVVGTFPPDKDGWRRCRECAYEDGQASRIKRGIKPRAGAPRLTEQERKAGRCREGHDVSSPEDRTYYLRCKVCRAQYHNRRKRAWNEQKRQSSMVLLQDATSA
jgi:hypothetical protein